MNYSYYIVKAGETAPEERINQAISNFNYTDRDVVCIAKGGYTSIIETIITIRSQLNDSTTTDLDELAKAYINKLIADDTKSNEIVSE